MNDWLTDLREEKKRVIAELEKSPVHASRAFTEEQLRVEQERISEILREVQVEIVLEEFVNEIVRGHPWFPSSALIRSVTSREADSALERREQYPWSGSVKGNLLPPNFNLADRRYVARIDWNLGLNYRQPRRHMLQALAIAVTLNAASIQVDGENILPATQENLQAAIKNSFQNAIQTAETQRASVRHRRKRRWYRRLWRFIFRKRTK